MRHIPVGLIRFAVSAVLVLMVFAAVTAFGFFASATTAEREPGPGSEPLRVNTHAVDWETGYTVERSFVGRVEARRSSDLGFEIGGMVKEVLVEEGESVEAGQLIARLDTDRILARRAELIAARDQAQADYDLAKITRRRVLGTASRGAASQQEIDNVEQTYSAMSSALERAKAAIASIDVEIAKSEITSPFAAVVATRYVDEGRVISHGSPVVRLLEKSSPEVRVGVGGELIEQVRVGQRLDVLIRSRKVVGWVTAILPTREERARGVDVVIRLEAELDGIREGDLARVSIPRQITEDGFWVPTQSLTEGVRGLWSLYLVEQSKEAESDSVLKRIDVEVLHTRGDAVYVRGAIESDELVVADGLQRIAPGMTVRALAPVEGSHVAFGERQ